MSLASKQTDDLVRIVEAGGGLTLDASNRSTDDLVLIAEAAASSDARVTFRKVGGRDTDELVLIAEAGGGNVGFVD